jgi:membrane protein required for colicin V production
MQAYDLIMLAVLAGAALFGLWKGLAWQVASLASFVASYLVALNFSSRLAPYISAEEPWNRFAAMAILFVGTAAAVWLVFGMLREAIEKARLASFDRQLGALLGAAKGVVLCVVITFFAVTLSEAGREQVLRSRSGVYIARLIDRADPLMPPEVHKVLGPYLKELEGQLQGGRRPPVTTHRSFWDQGDRGDLR